MTMFLIQRDVINQPFKILFIGIDRYILLWNRYTEPGTGHQVFRVLRDEGSAVQTRDIGNLKDFNGFKRCQINPGNSRCIVSVDKQPSSVKFTILLRKFDMVGIIPWNKAIRCVE